ncbi:UDP-forming cellulose synthase catalytic subunit [Palleronia abyssalis]|uniref:Cellulose synthase catalytic subunit [UDP-forming] n=1 Tax=Palleronia abyssalis TaxID=1501240 RepID=A0A2R8C0P2_9RHOB|nr:UDP-forming cellulose synthase catalytic subunit [Palleronia abyssalis]SPJ25962.1 Cellulose synthase catalytic subunit [UDP-forming] [Palleronia abyssalis]
MRTAFSKRSGFALNLAFWSLSVALVVFFASVSTSVSVQALLGLLAVAAILILRPYISSPTGRMIFLGIASIVALRYWFWRLLNTLPSLDDPISFAAASLLFGIETYAIGVFFLGNFIMADPVRRAPPPPVEANDLPSVDVLIPSYNEPTDLLAITLAAACNLDYPRDKLTIVLCDDGGTDQRCSDPDPGKARAAQQRRRDLFELCRKLGVTYRTRPFNRSAKAGNLNEALAHLSGELVVIFDADHAPTPDFLMRTVGYFSQNPRLFLVQTPHFFLNDDPVARNLGLGAAPPENEMFYRQLHEGLDRWGGAFFCGSAAVLRRRALDEVGGISGTSITEDAETALQIHGRGWESLYVNHAMIAGLQPETFASFLQQRGRWATGMIQLLMTRNPFTMPGLSLFQRLCYFNSMVYWLFPVFRLILLMAPLSYVFFGVELFVTSASEALAYMLSYLTITYLVQNTLFGASRHPFLSEIYEIAQAPYLARAVIGAIVNPRKADFKVTSKDETIYEDTISDVFAPLAGLFAILIAGLVVIGWRYYAFPGDRSVLELVGAWVIFNTALTGAALRAVMEVRQRRQAPRAQIAAAGSLVLRSSRPEAPGTPVSIRDVSYGGAGLSLKTARAGGGQPFFLDDKVLLALAEDGAAASAPIEARVANVRVESGETILGLAFDAGQAAGGLRTIARLLNGSSARWEAARARRGKHQGLVAGLARLVVLALSGIGTIPALLLAGRGDTANAPAAEPQPGVRIQQEIRREEAASAIRAEPTPIFVHSAGSRDRSAISSHGA